MLSEPLYFHILELFHGASLHFFTPDKLCGSELNLFILRAKEEKGHALPALPAGTELPWVGTVDIAVDDSPSTTPGCWEGVLTGQIISTPI